ncbi:hypothetical protein SLITO_v1c07340 [Spiroplasma litorale]|uniref:Uncharacterized protein n=1 Tax=Spiroplasma litorale TaxID=216942 RepID=A0A0K1W218_9MOLU|nr:hypothetical protein [Spiroplasma litorale]AKX34359.1 hypothetical protein SLITO_v1c07340 [Spiroplasma litorale]
MKLNSISKTGCIVTIVLTSFAVFFCVSYLFYGFIYMDYLESLIDKYKNDKYKLMELNSSISFQNLTNIFFLIILILSFPNIILSSLVLSDHFKVLKWAGVVAIISGGLIGGVLILCGGPVKIVPKEKKDNISPFTKGNFIPKN